MSYYPNATVVITSGASSQFLGADGVYRSIAAGGITNAIQTINGLTNSSMSIIGGGAVNVATTTGNQIQITAPNQTAPTITINGSTTSGNFVIAGGGYMTTNTAQSGVTLGVATSALTSNFASISTTATSATGSYIAPNGSFVQLPAHDGPVVINGSSASSAFTITAGSFATASTSNNGVTIGVNSTALTGFAKQTVSTVNASNSYLAADGGFYTVAGGNVTNNYSGVLAQGLSASTTNVATGGSIYYSGVNIVVSLTTNANGSHVLQISKEADIYNSGFVLGGNTFGSSSFGNTGEEKMTIAATSGLFVSGTSNNAISVGIQPNSSHYFNNRGDFIISSGSMATASNSLYLAYAPVIFPHQISRVDCAVTYNCMTISTSGSTQSMSQSITAVIYSNNANTLTPIVGGTTSTTWVWGGSQNTTGSNSLITGGRFVSVPVATTLLPGEYYVGFQFATATATAGGSVATTIGLAYASNILTNISSQWNYLGSGSAASRGLVRGGVLGTQLTNTTQNVNMSLIGAASTDRRDILCVFNNNIY